MGNILIDAFLETRAVKPSCLTIINRTPAKAYHIKEKHPSVHIAKTIDEVIERSHLIFICVKPIDIYPILQKYAEHFSDEKCLVSITSPISPSQLETLVPCHVARIIPSITNRAYPAHHYLHLEVTALKNGNKNYFAYSKTFLLPL